MNVLLDWPGQGIRAEGMQKDPETQAVSSQQVGGDEEEMDQTGAFPF